MLETVQVGVAAAANPLRLLVLREHRLLGRAVPAEYLAAPPAQKIGEVRHKTFHQGNVAAVNIHVWRVATWSLRCLPAVVSALSHPELHPARGALPHRAVLHPVTATRLHSTASWSPLLNLLFTCSSSCRVWFSRPSSCSPVSAAWSCDCSICSWSCSRAASTAPVCTCRPHSSLSCRPSSNSAVICMFLFLTSASIFIFSSRIFSSSIAKLSSCCSINCFSLSIVSTFLRSSLSSTV